MRLLCVCRTKKHGFLDKRLSLGVQNFENTHDCVENCKICKLRLFGKRVDLNLHIKLMC